MPITGSYDSAVTDRRSADDTIEAAQPRTTAQTMLLALLVTSIASTAIHFTDNALFIESYPQPGYISVPLIVVSWIAWTVAGVLGYWLYRRDERSWPAHALLLVYSYAGISTLGHYLYGSPSELPIARNVSIIADGAIGFGILAFTVWSVFRIVRRQPAI